MRIDLTPKEQTLLDNAYKELNATELKFAEVQRGLQQMQSQMQSLQGRYFGAIDMVVGLKGIDPKGIIWTIENDHVTLTGGEIATPKRKGVKRVN